jgi:hypothetical protein
MGGLFMLKKLFSVMLVIAMLGCLVGCIDDQYVEGVKNSTPSMYTNVTYGEAFESFFSSPEWRTTGEEDGYATVEFTGGFSYGGKDTEAEIEIAYHEGATIAFISSVAFDGVPQDDSAVYALINAVFGG